MQIALLKCQVVIWLSHTTVAWAPATWGERESIEGFYREIFIGISIGILYGDYLYTLYIQILSVYIYIYIYHIIYREYILG